MLDSMTLRIYPNSSPTVLSLSNSNVPHPMHLFDQYPRGTVLLPKWLLCRSNFFISLIKILAPKRQPNPYHLIYVILLHCLCFCNPNIHHTR